MDLLGTLIDNERRRMMAAGYATDVSVEEVTVGTCLRTLALGNSAYILTGVRGGADDITDGGRRIGLYSPAAAFQASAKTFATLGTYINHVFRSYLVITTLPADAGFTEAVEDFARGAMASTAIAVPTYTLEFVKVTPVRKTN